jgi:hypothetical protein
MRSPSLIVAERGETDKKVSAEKCPHSFSLWERARLRVRSLKP